jgi:phosphoribosylformylglycinamidine synthase
MWLARVYVTLKPTVNDPQGLAIRGGLHHLGFESVRAGKYLQLRLDEHDEGRARERVDAMCRQLLANPVTEDYHVQVRGMEGGAS